MRESSPTPSPSPMAAPPKEAGFGYGSAPSPVPVPVPVSAPATSNPAGSHARIAPDLSPPLIAMVAVVGTAFLIVLYARILSHYLRLLRRRFRRWRRRRRLFQSTAAAPDIESGGGAVSFGSSSDYFYSPYGLDDAAIKAIPISHFSKSKAKYLASTNRDCAVCLLEFEDDDYLRTLPFCSHAFHVDCIDVWLRSHANCPLCRTAVIRSDSSPFVPMRAARIRPSFEDMLLYPNPPPVAASIAEAELEISPAAASPPPMDRMNGRDFLLKRSYSFGFERSIANDRLVLEASTASPWRYRQRSFWSKRWPSPFGGGGGGGGSRVFSFRSYRGGGAGKSPFMRRRGFLPLSSERAGPSSRRTRSMTSPSTFLMRPAAAIGFSSSRMRCGDPEALLSPERLNRG
ncbi:RING-H2 finger protein ATL65 [Typha angustifolia]|uniref:RING-H2 finger protein ATL65 n=1 Tax=Typha angustifolia TaxID=59011 RepID=UPI003C2FDEE9